MATRTVRLDEQTEAKLQKLRKSTGLSISEVLKRGVEALTENAVREPPAAPYDVYRRIELDAGGSAVAPARDAKKAIRAAIARKHGR